MTWYLIRDLINNDQNGLVDKEQDPMIHEMIEEFIKIYNTVPDSVIISHDYVQLSDNANNSSYTTSIPNNTTISPPHNDASTVPQTKPSIINESRTESNENMRIIMDQKRYLAFQYKLSLIEEKLTEIMFLKSVKRQTLVESKSLSLIYPSISVKLRQKIRCKDHTSALINLDEDSLPYCSIDSTLFLPPMLASPSSYPNTLIIPDNEGMGNTLIVPDNMNQILIENTVLVSKVMSVKLDPINNQLIIFNKPNPQLNYSRYSQLLTRYSYTEITDHTTILIVFISTTFFMFYISSLLLKRVVTVIVNIQKRRTILYIDNLEIKAIQFMVAGNHNKAIRLLNIGEFLMHP
jgi:hypothetical protein